MIVGSGVVVKGNGRTTHCYGVPGAYSAIIITTMLFIFRR
jgi:hypothetical protein